MQNPTYDEIFQRNIGIFTPEEQEKIKNLKIAIIGVGGIGAQEAESLARLGVGELRLVDPDNFEIPNINHQEGAFLDTVGRNKAVVMAEITRRINPEISLVVKSKKIHDVELKQTITGCDLIFDGIDFFNIDDEIELHRCAKELKIPIVEAQGCFDRCSFSYFDPDKAMLSDLLSGKDVVENILQATYLFFPVLPAELTPEFIKELEISFLSGNGVLSMPSSAMLPPFGKAITTKIIVDILIKTENKKDVLVMPDILYCNVSSLEITRFYR